MSTTDRKVFLLAAVWFTLLMIAGCGGGTGDDLFPSGDDKRPETSSSEIGGMPGNTAPDFSFESTDNEQLNLADYLADGRREADAVVIYFTMWCPVCSAHMNHIQFSVMPLFSDKRVVYLAVDYLSASTETTRISQQESGFTNGGWLVTADPGQTITALFSATMGTTVVIDPEGIVQMNEDFRNGDNLVTTLNSLQ